MTKQDERWVPEDAPKKIYLQWAGVDHDELEEGQKFKDGDEICWCGDRIFDTDLEYRLVSAPGSVVAEQPQAKRHLCPSCKAADNNGYINAEGIRMRACDRCMIQWRDECCQAEQPSREQATTRIEILTLHSIADKLDGLAKRESLGSEDIAFDLCAYAEHIRALTESREQAVEGLVSALRKIYGKCGNYRCAAFDEQVNLNKCFICKTASNALSTYEAAIRRMEETK